MTHTHTLTHFRGWK